MFKYDVCVIGGAGRVGLPLSIAFANMGKRVVINDINKKTVELINRGVMPFLENGADDILKKVINKTLTATCETDVISGAEFVFVVIGTPVDEHLNPNFNSIKKFFESIVPHFKKGQVVILRSTVYPGTSKKVRNIIQKKHPDVEVCFCPERILEGKAMEELYSLPQLISGFNEKAVSKVCGLFKLLTGEIILMEPLEAELAKLFMNSWRYLQFSIANQFYMIAEEHGLDFHKIFRAMTHNYPRAKSFPKPGFAAGPCLFKDTMQLSVFANNNFFLGHSAMLVNEGLPNFIVKQIKNKYNIEEMKIGILGMAFKAESDDKRESLSYKLKKMLEIEASEVYCSDVFIREESFISEKKLIEKSDIVIIGAPHVKYKKLDYLDKILIDVWDYIK